MPRIEMPKIDAYEFVDCDRKKWDALSEDDQVGILYTLFGCSKKEALVILKEGYDG